MQLSPPDRYLPPYFFPTLFTLSDIVPECITYSSDLTLGVTVLRGSVLTTADNPVSLVIQNPFTA